MESKIFYYSDRIYIIGVVGVLRFIRQVYGEWSIDTILKNLQTRWEGLAFPETRDVALKDYEYVKDYFLRLKHELGEK